jgi:hypothetical protein
LAGLTWNRSDNEDKHQLPPLTIDELAVLLGGQQRRAWEHLHELRRRGYIKWTKAGDELSIRLEFSTTRKPIRRMQSFAYDDRVRANLATLAEFGVGEKEPGALGAAQLEYVTSAFIRAWGAELMNTPGVKQLGRLLLHKLNNTQSLPRREEHRGGSRKNKSLAQSPLPAGSVSKDDNEPGNADDGVELPADLIAELKAIGWTDDFAEVKEYFRRDPARVWRCLIHARTSKKAKNKSAVFRYRLRQSEDASPAPPSSSRRSSSCKPSASAEYVDDNDLF